MRTSKRLLFVLLLGVVLLLAIGATASGDESKRVVIRDDCDPRDPAWGPLGGCALRRGDVTVAEFDEELISPLARSVVGHQAWRNDPSYLKIKAGDTVRVVNRGGRPHTFTRVAEFGGGFVPPLSVGLDFAPECGNAAVIPPGGRTEVRGLTVGNHRFMCCIHPWMRTLVKAKTERDRDDEEDDD
jgi:plastocyanin